MAVWEMVFEDGTVTYVQAESGDEAYGVAVRVWLMSWFGNDLTGAADRLLTRHDGDLMAAIETAVAQERGGFSTCLVKERELSAADIAKLSPDQIISVDQGD